jgi:hypothetical protein
VSLILTRPLAVIGAGAAALALLTACGGGSDSSGGQPSSAAQAATVRTATCDSWNAAPRAEQDQLVVGMREFFGGQVDSPGLRGQVLPDDKARRLFNTYCAQPFAGAFNLYRLYGNAAAFTNPQK